MYMEMFEEAYENYTKEYGNDFNRCIVNPDIFKGLKEECNIPIHNQNLTLLDIKIDYGLGAELFYFYKHEDSLLTYNTVTMTTRPIIDIGGARIGLNSDVYFNVNRQITPREYYISGGSISSDSIRDNSISSSRFSNGLNGYMTIDEIDFTRE